MAQRRYIKDDRAKGVKRKEKKLKENKRKEMGGGRVRVKLGMLL